MDYQYITTPQGLDAALNSLRGQSPLGVDTEAAGYHRYHDRISLIQISSRSDNFLVDPLTIDDLGGLAVLLEDPEVEKIFHDADFDLRILDRDLDLHVENLFDTQVAASFAGAPGLGLGAVVEHYLGVNLPKAYQRADWAERPLTEGMMTYAARDTAYLPDLRDRLIADLEKLGRLHWAEEEFKIREGIRWSEPDDGKEAFMRLKGARDLTPRGLAVLRELFNWREEVGRERDQATFRILSNAPMLEMALKAPQSMNDLRAISGVSSGLLARRGSDILGAIRKGVAVPDDELPTFPKPKRWDRDIEAEVMADELRKIRNDVAGKLNLDPGFLISRAVLEEVARVRPNTDRELAEIPEVRNWQVEAIGSELLRTLRG